MLFATGSGWNRRRTFLGELAHMARHQPGRFFGGALLFVAWLGVMLWLLLTLPDAISQ